MVCHVIKTIKGHQYLYEQTSYRVDGKVKTETRYLGKVQAPDAKPSPTPSPDNESNNVRLTITADLHPHKISEKATHAADTRFLDFMRRKGIMAENIPPIKIINGATAAIQKYRFGNGYKITVPKHAVKNTRGEFWRHFRKAQAFQYLDALEKSDPKYFAGLFENLEKFYHQQNRAIAVYIMRSRRTEVFKIGLTLHFLYSKMVNAWTQRHIDPKLIGLSDYSNRRTWRDDTATLMAEILRDGWTNCYQKYCLELQRNEAIQFSLFRKYRQMKRRDFWGAQKRAALRDWRKMNARRNAVFQTCNKISVLAPLFNGFRESLQNSNLPFHHEENWKETRGKWYENITNAKFKFE